MSAAVRVFALAHDLDPDGVDVWGFGDSDRMAFDLGALVLAGTKTATAGLVWDYENDGDPLPQVGDVSIFTDYARRTPLGALEVTEVRVAPFSACDPQFARDEGEGDLTLPWWREAHWAFFSRVCEQIGKEPSEEMLVVYERFRLVAKA